MKRPFWAIFVLMLSSSLPGADLRTGGDVRLVSVPNGGQAIAARISPDGVIHLIYTSGAIPYYVKTADGGATFSRPLPVVEPGSRQPGLEYTPMSMAVGKGDAVYVAMITNNWRLKLPDVPDGLVYSRLTPGAADFTPVRSLNGKPSEGFSLAANQQGDVAATWLAGKLFANFSQDAGKTFTPNAEINSSYLPCECCTTSTTYGPGGNLALLYRERTNDERDVYLVLIGKDGHPSRTRVSSTLWKINACPMTYYMLSATPQGYVAAWPTRGEIYFARLDSSGKVEAPGEIKTPGRSGMRTGVVALGAPNGNALVAWKHDDELGWQVYDSAGLPEGQPGSAPSAGKGAAGVVDRNGQFILFQ